MNNKMIGVLCLAAMVAGAINHNPNDPAWQKRQPASVVEQSVS